MSDFIVFYDNEKTISANASTLDKVQPFGVVCIVQNRTENKKHILYGRDYYAFNGRHWLILDIIGLIDHLVHKPDSIKKFIVGRTIDNEAYNKIMSSAKSHV